VDLHGKRITVPKGWYPDEILYYDISFSKPRLTIFSQRPSVLLASFYVNPGKTEGSRQEADERFEATWRHVYAGTDYQTAPAKLFVKEADGFCMMHSPRQYPSWTFIDCSLFASQWTASFIGNTSEAETFLNVIRGIKPIDR
jgi:hypothetical protein